MEICRSPYLAGEELEMLIHKGMVFSARYVSSCKLSFFKSVLLEVKPEQRLLPHEEGNAAR